MPATYCAPPPPSAAARGRTGVYDIDVRNQQGKTVALFRGKSYRIDGHVVDET